MSVGPRKPLDYETPETRRGRPRRRNPREELVWAFARGSAIGAATAFLLLCIASGMVSDIPAGFACTVVGAAAMVATVGSFILFCSLELTWRLAREDPGLRSPAAATWMGMLTGTLTIMAGAVPGFRGAEFPAIVACAGITLLIASSITGWWLVIRDLTSDAND